MDSRAHNLELHSYYRRQVEPRKSWGQAKHSGVGGAALEDSGLEDSGELYISTHFLGLHQLDSMGPQPKAALIL